MTTQVRRTTLLAFIGPAVFALLIVGIVPLFYAVWKSLHYFNLTKIAQQRFVGLENYLFVLTDNVFWQAMGRTALLFILSCTAPD
jgi:multiple sugar transport system permease protein